MKRNFEYTALPVLPQIWKPRQTVLTMGLRAEVEGERCIISLEAEGNSFMSLVLALVRRSVVWVHKRRGNKAYPNWPPIVHWKVHCFFLTVWFDPSVTYNRGLLSRANPFAPVPTIFMFSRWHYCHYPPSLQTVVWLLNRLNTSSPTIFVIFGSNSLLYSEKPSFSSLYPF